MVGEATVLLVTDAVVLPATPVLWALKAFEDKVASGKNLALVTQATHLSEKLETESSFAEVLVSLAETPGRHTTAWLAEASRILRPGGTLIIQEPICRTPNPQPELYTGRWKSGAVHTEANLRMNLLLAGFMHLTTCEALDGLSSSAIFSQDGLQSSLSASVSALQPLLIKAQKPEWESGSSFTIKKSPYIPKEISIDDAQVVCSPADGTDIAQPILGLKANGTTSFETPVSEFKAEELVDEDALLTEEDLAKPLPMPDGDDCEVGKSGRKACKNCTCGRAELEEKGSLTTEQIQNPQSACGNCGLGDAFRCGSCPYRGLPRFKLGEKISLPGALLRADM